MLSYFDREIMLKSIQGTKPYLATRVKGFLFARNTQEPMLVFGFMIDQFELTPLNVYMK